MSGAGISRPPVHRVSIVQTLVLLVVWAALGFLSPAAAHSVLLGGLIAIVPQAWFTYRVFRWRGARSARQIARASYSGEIGKFVLAVTGFALVFAFVRPLQPLALFTAYGGMLIIQVIGTWYFLRDAQIRRP